MALAWNEIRSRALEFSKRWENETSEDAEAKPFWIEFLNIFGIDRKRVASFEEPVKKLGDQQGYIDLFWKGMLLVEHKSRGKGLDRGLHADGKTYQAAVANVEVIVKEWVQTAKELGRPIPQPRGRLMFA